jgi:hypothetical protein
MIRGPKVLEVEAPVLMTKTRGIKSQVTGDWERIVGRRS